MDAPIVLRARLTSLVIVFAALAFVRSAASETVSFEFAPQLGDSITLSAELTKPEGDGPFPAVVLLHGCSGVWRPWGDLWAGRLVRWGYLAFQVDSFSPRGVPEGICDSDEAMVPWVSVRADDAHAAKDYLKRLPFVDRDRIAVMGMSHGGWTTLSAVENTYFAEVPRPHPFKAAVALYPPCDQQLYRLDAPLLILIGEADDWTFAYRCERMVQVGASEHTATLKVYPGATHTFDVEGPDRVYLGHRIRFHPSAARDAEARIRAFLAEHLK